MECDCECHCGWISPREAMNDRLCWVEYNGVQCAAWRGSQSKETPWIVPDAEREIVSLVPDSRVGIIHEIIPEE